MTPEQQAESRSRCLIRWPWAINGEYNPNCCRWPKSCSIEDYPEALEKPVAEGGSIPKLGYDEDSIPVTFTAREPQMLEVGSMTLELNTNVITASIGDDEMAAPTMLNLQRQPLLDTGDTVTFAEDEPWDQYTAMMHLVMSRAAWEAQGSPETIWTSMMTIRTVEPKENE